MTKLAGIHGYPLHKLPPGIMRRKSVLQIELLKLYWAVHRSDESSSKAVTAGGSIKRFTEHRTPPALAPAADRYRADPVVSSAAIKHLPGGERPDGPPGTNPALSALWPHLVSVLEFTRSSESERMLAESRYPYQVLAHREEQSSLHLPAVPTRFRSFPPTGIPECGTTLMAKEAMFFYTHTGDAPGG